MYSDGAAASFNCRDAYAALALPSTALACQDSAGTSQVFKPAGGREMMIGRIEAITDRVTCRSQSQHCGMLVDIDVVDLCRVLPLFSFLSLHLS